MSHPHQINNSGSPLVAPLTYFERTGLSLAGGKGANLGELIKAGFDVPPGFIITTAAYDLLLLDNNLDARLRDILASFTTDDPASVKQTGQQIREALNGASIPAMLADEVLKAYRLLGSGAVAVRSSATAEDLPEAAFAGQQETFLNVIGEQALLEAIAHAVVQPVGT